MKQYFELQSKEKKQEWLLLTLVLLFFSTIAMGVYYQAHNKDHDNILIPLFFVLGSGIFFVYAINAFGKGNLIQKWTPPYIFQPLLFLKKRLSSSAAGNANKFVIHLLGIISLIIFIGLFITAILSTKGTLW